MERGTYFYSEWSELEADATGWATWNTRDGEPVYSFKVTGGWVLVDEETYRDLYEMDFEFTEALGESHQEWLEELDLGEVSEPPTRGKPFPVGALRDELSFQIATWYAEQD